MNVVVGEKMAAKVSASGVPRSKIRVVPNWCNDEDIDSDDVFQNPLRAAWNLEGKFVVGYSGNLGRAHEFETVLGAAEQLRHNSQIIFLFIGGGHSFDELAETVVKRNLESIFRFLPYQNREQLRYSLAVPDVHLLSLRPTLEGLIVPSKFYGIAAAGRPLIAVMSKDGEFAPFIKQYRCGVVIEPGQTSALAEAISNLASNQEECTKMGGRARNMLKLRFTQRQAFERWKSVLDQVEAFGRSQFGAEPT